MKKETVMFGAGFYGPLKYKGKDVIPDEPMTVAHIHLTKDGKHWDMRFKENKYWYKIMFPKKPWWDITLQKIANKLGAPSFGAMGRMSWRNYLHPVKYIRHLFTGIWYL